MLLPIIPVFETDTGVVGCSLKALAKKDLLQEV